MASFRKKAAGVRMEYPVAIIHRLFLAHLFGFQDAIVMARPGRHKTGFRLAHPEPVYQIRFMECIFKKETANA